MTALTQQLNVPQLQYYSPLHLLRLRHNFNNYLT